MSSLTAKQSSPNDLFPSEGHTQFSLPRGIDLKPSACLLPPRSPHLLVVLDAHAESIDQDGDHDAPVEVFTLHNPFQLLPEAYPGPDHSVSVLHRPPPSAAAPAASQIHALENGGGLFSDYCGFMERTVQSRQVSGHISSVDTVDTDQVSWGKTLNPRMKDGQTSAHILPEVCQALMKVQCLCVYLTIKVTITHSFLYLTHSVTSVPLFQWCGPSAGK